MELNNVSPPATNIHHTSVGPSHTLEIIPKNQACTPSSSSSPQGILVMEQRPDYTNVLFQDAQDPWEDFQSLLHTENSHYTVTNPDASAPSAPKEMTDADEEAYLQVEAYLDQRQIRRAKRANMKKQLVICLHHTTHPLHDCRHAWEFLAFAFYVFAFCKVCFNN